MALGDPIVNGEPGRTPVWASTDGETWSRLDADVFGPSTVVLGMGATADGLVALTQPGGVCTIDPEIGPSSLECALGVPLHAWTTLDGTTWTAHDVPDIAPWKTFQDGFSILGAATINGIVSVLQPDGSLMISRDGIAWKSVSPSPAPQGWELGFFGYVTATPLGFIAFGHTGDESTALWSGDGRSWATSLSTKSLGMNSLGLVSGPAGMVALGLEDLPLGRARWHWWQSPDGRKWDELSGYPPLGAWTGVEAQECDNGCPNGMIIGNGERMLAYRSGPEDAAWTSFDGRSWQRLALEGDSPTDGPPANTTASISLTPIGVLWHDSDGSMWYGAPTGGD